MAEESTTEEKKGIGSGKLVEGVDLKTVGVAAAVGAIATVGGKFLVEEYREHREKRGAGEVTDHDFPVVTELQSLREDFRKRRKEFARNRPRLLGSRT